MPDEFKHRLFTRTHPDRQEPQTLGDSWLRHPGIGVKQKPAIRI